jgi:hypothetical protein
MTNGSLAASLLAEVSKCVAKAQGYLLGRQSDAGGFCFYRAEGVDEPNLRDTYHAIVALNLLGTPVPDPGRVVEFVERARLFGLTYVYYYAFTLGLLGLSNRIGAQELAQIRDFSIGLPARIGSTSSRGWFEDTRRKVRLKRRFAGAWDFHQLVVALLASRIEGGYGEKPNLWDTHSSLAILDSLGQRQEMQASASFVEAMQGLPFGFRLTRGSIMANLEVVHAGVQCCALLGLPIRYKTDVLELVLACQTADGGFSRTPTALPDIDLTHQALRVIALTTGKTPILKRGVFASLSPTAY